MINNYLRLVIVSLFIFAALAGKGYAQTEVAPGVYKITVGQPDKFTPYAFSTEKPLTQAMAQLPTGKMPFGLDAMHVTTNSRGVVVEVPLSEDEQLYGFGLQIGSFNQRGLRKRPIVNDNPLNDVGYTHAPTTFYLSNKGYGILVNTARYTTFYCGTTNKLSSRTSKGSANSNGGNSVQELYGNKGVATGYLTADVPGAQGIEIFVFYGPDMLSALQRYNLFSGGGALPAMWGLGVKYRVKADFKQDQVDKMAAYFRENHMPCDVLGLEPRWQTASYSCSYVWNKDFFPQPEQMTANLLKKGFHVNLWEHAFVHPSSPIYNPLQAHAGDYMVWNGLVPDFADTAAANVFANYHRNTFVKQGISGFKMDECDNSNLATGDATWSFPELSRFPSGQDGEQMHQLFGLLYQKTIYQIYRDMNIRTYLDVRSSNAFASSYPAALYSDTYDHNEYIRMIVNSGFSGLIWSPEVRESNTVKDLMRRSQTAVLSAQTLYNSWYLQNPPWLQIEKEKNNNNELMPDAKQVESDMRKLLNLRMQLVPYLYNAFAEYRFKGTPPFRALIVDYPQDKNVFNISNEYMIGAGLLAAPLTEKENDREVYLPAGTWYDFNTGKKFEGGQKYRINPSYTELPLFVKEGTVLPLADVVEYITPQTSFNITCYAYGADAKGALFADDGTTFNFEKGQYQNIALQYTAKKGTAKTSGSFKGRRYKIAKWVNIN